MRELAEALASMTEETFAYHLNAEKKDFSNWVRDIIGDKKLAEELESALDRNQAASMAAGRIDNLSRILA